MYPEYFCRLYNSIIPFFLSTPTNFSEAIQSGMKVVHVNSFEDVFKGRLLVFSWVWEDGVGLSYVIFTLVGWFVSHWICFDNIRRA